MTNQTPATSLCTKHAPFGTRLKSAREALGMDRKEIAAQLRLHEKMIIMIESGEYKTDIPMTFIRGYIRNYSKLVGIPEKDLHEAMELLKPKPEVNADETFTPITASGPAATAEQYMPVNFGNFFMRLFTCLLAVTVIGLMGVWWHTHKSTPNDLSFQNQVASILPAETPTPDVAGNTIAPAPIPAPQQITPANTSIVIIPAASNQAGKAAFKQLTSTNHPIQFLMSLILFLLIITASMRLYTMPIMAGVRTKRLHRQNQLTFDYVKLFTFSMKLSIPLFALAIIFLFGSWWYHHASKHVAAPVAKQPVIANTKPEAEPAPESTLPLTADLETLAPSATQNSLLLAGIQPYFFQSMMMQLDNYISQADETKFALTDKSMPIGQFVGKRTPRRHRSTYYTNFRNNSNNQNAVPYYYQQQQ